MKTGIIIYDTVKAREKLFSKIIIRHANAKGEEAYEREYNKYMDVYEPKQDLESDKPDLEASTNLASQLMTAKK